jgi:hypothetical protein
VHSPAHSALAVAVASTRISSSVLSPSIAFPDPPLETKIEPECPFVHPAKQAANAITPARLRENAPSQLSTTPPVAAHTQPNANRRCSPVFVGSFHEHWLAKPRAA